MKNLVTAVLYIVPAFLLYRYLMKKKAAEIKTQASMGRLGSLEPGNTFYPELREVEIERSH